MDYSQLKHLAIFAEVVTCGSFASAARKLGSSRSRVSEQVAQLEAALGVRLLQRTTRQLNLTAEGRDIYHRARVLPELLSDVEDASSQEIARGRVALTVNHDIAIARLLPVLNEFQQKYPRIELDLVVCDDPLDLIAEQIDVAIRIGVPKDDSLIMRPLFSDRMQLFASQHYLQRFGMPEDAAGLHEHRWIALQQAGPVNELTMFTDDQSVLLQPGSYHMCNSPLMVQRMVIAGFGISCLLPSTVRDEIDRGVLQPVLPELRGEALQFSLVYPSRRQLPLRSRCLIEYLLAAKMFG